MTLFCVTWGRAATAIARGQVSQCSYLIRTLSLFPFTRTLFSNVLYSIPLYSVLLYSILRYSLTFNNVLLTCPCSPTERRDPGVCLPWHTKAPLNATGCHCSAGYYGPSCADTEDPFCSSTTHVNLEMTLTDSYGDGWTFANYALTDVATGLIVGNAIDSLCTGSNKQTS